MKTRTTAFTLIELVVVVAIIAIIAGIAVPNFLEAQVRSKFARTEGDMAVTAAALRAYFADHNQYPRNAPETRAFLKACARLDDAKQPDAPPPSPRNPEMAEFSFFAQQPVTNNALNPINRTTLPTPEDAAASWTMDDPDYLRRPGNPPRDPGTFIRPYFPILCRSGWDLSPLTTPIPYFSRQLSFDPFCDIKNLPFVYVNLGDVFSGDLASSSSILHTSGIREGPGKRYILLSYGPDTDMSGPSFTNPVRGPFVPYDVTNGTVSKGDIVLFGY